MINPWFNDNNTNCDAHAEAVIVNYLAGDLSWLQEEKRIVRSECRNCQHPDPPNVPTCRRGFDRPDGARSVYTVDISIPR